MVWCRTHLWRWDFTVFSRWVFKRFFNWNLWESLCRILYILADDIVALYVLLLIGQNLLYNVLQITSLSHLCTLLYFIPLSLRTGVTCPDDRVDPVNGAIQIMTGLNFNSVVTYQCDLTYALIGNSTQSCGASGLWTNEPPTCQSKLVWYVP